MSEHIHLNALEFFSKLVFLTFFALRSSCYAIMDCFATQVVPHF